MADNFNISDQPAGGGTPVFVGVKVTHSVNQSIPDLTTTTLNFDGEEYDTSGFHDNVTNNERLTVPAGLGGTYIIGMDIEWDPSSGGQFRKASIILNGVTTIGVDSFRDVGSGADDENYNTITIERQLAVGDFVEIDVLHDEGAALDVVVAAAYSPRFWMELAGT